MFILYCKIIISIENFEFFFDDFLEECLLSSSVTYIIHLIAQQIDSMPGPEPSLEDTQMKVKKIGQEALFLMEETELQSDDLLHRLGSAMTKV